jgi:hypothetical protein
VTPKISILFPALQGYEAAIPALEVWERQDGREQLEILVLCPDHLGPTGAQGGSLPSGQIIVPVGTASLHDARAIGVARASGEYVMLAEDHCVPEPGWATAILNRIEEGWDGVAAALRAGELRSRWAEASFLIGYGEWMMPIDSGPTPVLCGLNGTIRTDLVRAFGATLRDELVIGAFLVRHLREQGCRFYLEAGAGMRHFDPDRFSSAVSALFALGLGFGAKRTESWPWAARWLYPLAAPAIALLHTKRAFVHYRRAGTRAGSRRTAPLCALGLAAAWAFGEAAGAALGMPRVEHSVWRAETRPVSREALARTLARPAIPEPS